MAAVPEPLDDLLPIDLYDLTARERQVLQLLAEGLTNKEIAARSHYAEQTIKNSVGSILRKLHVSRRADAASIARSVLH